MAHRTRKLIPSSVNHVASQRFANCWAAATGRSLGDLMQAVWSIVPSEQREYLARGPLDNMVLKVRGAILNALLDEFEREVLHSSQESNLSSSSSSNEDCEPTQSNFRNGSGSQDDPIVVE